MATGARQGPPGPQVVRTNVLERVFFKNPPGNEEIEDGDLTGTTIEFHKEATFPLHQYGLCLEISRMGKESFRAHTIFYLLRLMEFLSRVTHLGMLSMSTRYPDLICGWLNDYDSEHGQRPSTISMSTRSEFGFRVIHVQNYCVVPAPQPCQYAALSYVWGNVQQPVLRGDNINLWISRCSLLNIAPQTIKDAITVCQLLRLSQIFICGSLGTNVYKRPFFLLLAELTDPL
ncbi:hypothetical protein K469DRAFT_292765 [Zopfia rhizophila CBS 207.26]|uniref:Heterokaryon incompatibility domain-containing protein n=1 Tax=Zopfia rhizophila CBS 207.26 TaxID=1314779 RepID=A0A6A6DKG9_9PEZI|nr:hypothetical protein K469DRAFT_292765 [Zopfia rhizophila CBS 207.26]